MTGLRIVTLVTGDYHFGAAALINSLAATGFEGRVVVAHDKPPPWDLSPEARVTFKEIGSSSRWEGNLKAEILLSEEPGDVCYVDADCIVGLPFAETLAAEVQARPVFCAEGLIGGDDVRAYAWRRDMGVDNDPGRGKGPIVYINSGMFAVRLPRDLHLLTAWQELMTRALPGRGEMFQTDNYLMPDQDCLNALLLAAPFRYATLGPPDIWYRALPCNPFHHVGSRREVLLFHCTGGLKPWRLTRAPAHKPDQYDNLFRRFAFEETPWVRTRAGLPTNVRRWLSDEFLQRVARRLRNAF